MREKMTTAAFIRLLLFYEKQYYPSNEETPEEMQEVISKLRTLPVWQNVLEAQDEQQALLPIERRAAARILHVYLRDIIKEADTDDIRSASVLLDLYDCRVCVNHIAQMYVKGIMEPYLDLRQMDGIENGTGRRFLFGQREPVFANEAEAWMNRIFAPALRESN